MEMEHPIPQNVTSFQFHLVGDMTLKQFGYLASGMGFAYLAFVFLFPLSPILAIPLIAFSTLLGTAFAFLPILDRPLDHWVIAFFKAVYSPTQGLWKSPYSPNSKITSSEPIFTNRLQTYLQSLYPQKATPLTSPPPNTPKLTRLSPNINQKLATSPQIIPPTNFSIQSKSSIQQPTTPPLPILSPEELKRLVEMASSAKVFKDKLLEVEKELAHLKQIIAASNQPAVIPETLKIPIPSNTKKPVVQVVQPPKYKETKIFLTSLPNVINGIVTDKEGNYLEGVIVIIHNKENIPVRALKTNKLGQFTGATPLPSGTYTITLEKEGFEFDALQVTLEGNVMQPLTIKAKGEFGSPKGGVSSA